MQRARDSRRQKVTLQDVAEAAAVSKATASLALRDNPRISEATRQRVREAVDALGYVYNQHAASLRTRRSFTIGLIIGSFSNPFYAEFVAGSEAYLAKNRYGLLLGTNGADELERQARALRVMLERDVDGMILVPAAGTSPATLEQIVRHCPLVLATRYIPELAVDYVGIDNEAGARDATELLIRQGHRRIAFIGGLEASSARQDRLRGYRGALTASQIPVDPALCLASPVSRRGGYDAVQASLRLADPPTAALCYNDVVAFGVTLGLHAAGIEPGSRFAVVGCDDTADAALWQPSLTTISTDPNGMGERVAQLMLKRIANPDSPIEQIIMPSRLIIRDSTAARSSSPI